MMSIIVQLAQLANGDAFLGPKAANFQPVLANGRVAEQLN